MPRVRAPRLPPAWRPSPAWSGPAAAARRAARWATGAALVVFLLLATRGRPWTLFARGPFTSDFYDVQARSISRGRLAVPAEVASIEGFVVDGATHLYYGIVPALARVPISAATDALDGRLVIASQLVGLAVACLAGARLLQWARTDTGAAVPARWWPWLTAGFAAAVGLATPLTWLSSRALVYHEAELWGAALALAGFERIVAWWSTRRPADLAWASAAAALALSTRGSSGVGPALALAVLAAILAARRHARAAALALAAAALPVALYAAVNVARFDTPFGVPFEAQVLDDFSEERRAALAANDGTLFGAVFAPTAALHYLRPDTLAWSPLAPWFTWGDRADVIGDVTFDTVDRSASLPVTAPAFVGGAVVGAVAIARRRLSAAWPASAAAAAAAVVPTLTIAFIAQRYLADFAPVLVVGSAVAVPVVAARAAEGSARRARVMLAATLAVVTVGFAVNAGLAVLARSLHLLPSEAERRGFVAFQYAVHDALGGDRPPDVVEVDDLGPPGPDGTVAIVGACDGLFRSDGAAWSLLELRPGGALRAVVTGTAPGTVVTGDGWRIDLEVDGGQRRLVYAGSVRIESAELAADGPLTIDVRADPSIPTVVVDAGGERALEAFLRAAGGPVLPAVGWLPAAGAAPLCADLRSRLR